MLTVPEPRHSFLRNLMQPAFTPEAVGRYLPRVEVVVGRWLSSWAAAGDSVPGHQQFSAMTFDFILQVGRPGASSCWCRAAAEDGYLTALCEAPAACCAVCFPSGPCDAMAACPQGTVESIFLRLPCRALIFG
jgi:hypothetical protein